MAAVSGQDGVTSLGDFRPWETVAPSCFQWTEGRTRLWPGKQQEETLADLGFSRSVDKSLLVLPPAAVRSPGPHLEDRETEVTRLAKEIGLAC
ncbi:uncharacterized protein LOC144926976 isoform X3 [Branchiostoma floridae x Branchiostoma belcheri]